MGASFFCSRDLQDRSDLQLLFPTLAAQLAHRYTEFGTALVPVINSLPNIKDMSLFDQLSKFLIEPLKLTHISTVIVITALEECLHDDPVSIVLSLLVKAEDLPGVKFFVVTSTQNQLNKTGFYLRLLQIYNGSLSLYHVVRFPSVQNLTEAEIDTMIFIPPVCSVYHYLIDGTEPTT